jgi:hypothetical protein
LEAFLLSNLEVLINVQIKRNSDRKKKNFINKENIDIIINIRFMSTSENIAQASSPNLEVKYGRE